MRPKRVLRQVLLGEERPGFTRTDLRLVLAPSIQHVVIPVTFRIYCMNLICGVGVFETTTEDSGCV